MKIIFLTDTHFGGKNLTGFQMQPRYVENFEQIISALDRLAERECADLVIHGGDITENGNAEEIRIASGVVKKLLHVPLVLALGNHDCIQEDCEKLWLTGAPEFFPQGTLDTTLAVDGVRIDVLSLYWGRNGLRWDMGEGQFIRTAAHHLELLRSGRNDCPRIIAMHSQIRPARKEMTGLEMDLHGPENNFSAAADALIREFSPELILSGHIHMNLLEQIGETMAAAAASAAETPFECKVVEIASGKISMRTVPLAPELGFEPEYREESRYVQGCEAIRNFEKILNCNP